MRLEATARVLIVSALAVALALLGPLHLVLEPHELCSEHGLVPAHGDHGCCHGQDQHHDDPLNLRDEAHGHAHEQGHEHGHGDDGQSGGHDHDHGTCTWAMLLKAPGAAASAVIALDAPLVLTGAAPLQAAPQAWRPISILHVSPANSPPVSV